MEKGTKFPRKSNAIWREQIRLGQGYLDLK